jgi:putative acetyltransferase
MAPVAVLPEFQNRGIGSRLIRDGVRQCEKDGCDAVVVLGHPGYYRRFGFRRASEWGLENEYRATDAFMVLELNRGVVAQFRGLVRYAPEFGEVVC